MPSMATAHAADLLHGALDVVDAGDGWVRPSRFSAAQLCARSGASAPGTRGSFGRWRSVRRA